MMLGAWPQPAAAGELQFWLGCFGNETPPAPAFEVGGQPVQPLAPPQWRPIRDRQAGPGGQPLNHQAVVRLASSGADRPHKVAISAGGARIERVVHTPPESVPAKLDGSFNILVMSCYYQPEDGGALLGRVVSQLPVRPHLTLLAGDQVYVDLPLFEDLPEGEPALSRFIGEKYRRNWLSEQLGTAGLEAVLAKAPALCIPDDHEFWNNFPFRQAQLPGTWTSERRQRWTAAAQVLYEDYQQGGAPGSAPAFHRIDVDPLALLLLDTRCRRTEELDSPGGLMAPEAEAAVQAWTEDLLAAGGSASPRIGALAGGQALFVDKPGAAAAKMQDAEYGNYRQFADVVEAALGRLAEGGVPVVYLTGDVHWGRVAEAVHRPSGRPLLYEVICSPSRLIQTPGADQKALLADRLRGVFGTRQTWPRHGSAPEPPAFFGRNREFAPAKRFALRGDQVALVQFSRAGRGLEMTVSYHPIHADPDVGRPVTAGPYSLLPF